MFRGKVFVMLGAPASGKGTQCKLLAKKYGLVHISTGDVFRELCQQEDTELGVKAKGYLQNGAFVPDDFVMEYMRERLGRDDVKDYGCLLDGFPRTTGQAEALRGLARVDGVFMLDVPESALVNRAAERRIDPETEEIYHLQFVPPPAEVAKRLVPRDRDDAPSFRRRVAVYKEHVRRVLPLFSGRVKRIDATLTPAEVSEAIVRALGVEDAATR